MLDIRLPIGMLFLILGGLLSFYGLGTHSELYRICLGYNLNLWWGGVMAVFGLGMLGWMRLSPQVDSTQAQASSSLPGRTLESAAISGPRSKKT